MKDYLRTGLYVGIYSIIILTPLLYTHSLYFPAITGKAIFFYGMIQLLFVMYILHLFLDQKRLLPRISPILISLTAFVTSIGVSTFLSKAPSVSFLGNPERMDGFLTLLHLYVFFIIASAIFTTKKHWHRLFFSSLMVSGIIFLGAASEYARLFSTYGSETRVDVFLGNATFLGAYAMIHVFIASYLASLHTSQQWIWRILVLIALCNVATIIFSGTRAALLGLIAGFIIALCVYFLRTDTLRTKTKMVLIALFLLLASSGIGLIYTYRAQFENTPMVGRLLHLTPDTITEQPRFFLWKAAYYAVRENPFFGKGPEQFLDVYAKYYDPTTKSRFNVAIGETWADRAHNMYVEWFVAGGIIGGSLYILIFCTLLYSIIRMDLQPSTQGIWVGLIAAYMVNNLFAFDSFSTYVLFFSILGYTHTCSQRTTPSTIKSVPRALMALLQVVGFLLLLCIAVLFFTATIRSYVTAHAITNFLTAPDGSKQQLEQFNRITHMRLYTPWYTNAMLAEEIEGIAKQQTKMTEHAHQLIYNMQEYMMDNASMQNASTKSLFLYCKMLYSADTLTQAEKICEESAKKAPNTQDVLAVLGSVYRAQNAYASSTAVFKDAFELEKEYDPMRLEYAASLLYDNKKDEAHELLQERFGTHIVDSKSLLEAYIYTKDYDSALAVTEKHLQKNPEDLHYHLSRARIYLEQGMMETAIASLKEMQTINQYFDAIGAQIIQQVTSGKKAIEISVGQNN